MVRVKNIAREFSPAEVATITGVSTTLQRDWRRRGVLPERRSEGWSRFDVSDVIEIAVLKFFADAGFGVKSVLDVSSLATLPVMDLLGKAPGARAYEGEASDWLRAEIEERGTVRGAHGRYLAIAHAPGPKPDEMPPTVRVETLADLAEYLDGDDYEGATILDFEKLAARIVERAGLPLFVIEVENDTPSNGKE